MSSKSTVSRRLVICFALFVLPWLALVVGNYQCSFGENCKYPCHCKGNAECNPATGSCKHGCENTSITNVKDSLYTGNWAGPGCQKGNVAYDKNATQGPGSHQDGPAHNAIDGNNNPNYQGGRSCAHPRDSNLNGTAWWQVDLLDTYVISAVKITNREDCPLCRNRSLHMDIYVSESNYTSPSTTDICFSINKTYDFYQNCTRVMRGRYVTLKRKSVGIQKYQMNICEVEVFGYLYRACHGYFGVACSTPCHCEVACDDINGTCPGQNCSAGWEGSTCQTACLGSRWGRNCTESCNCQSDAVCDRVSGSCPDGCRAGYGGISCNLVLPQFNTTVLSAQVYPTSVEIVFNVCCPPHYKKNNEFGFVVQWSISDNDSWLNGTEFMRDGTDSSYTTQQENLEPNTTYYSRIWPFVKEGNYSYFGNPTQKTGPYTLPDVPTFHIMVVSAQVSPTSIEIVLNVCCPSHYKENNTLGFVVQWSIGDNDTWTNGTEFMHDGTDSNYTTQQENLEPNTTYYSRIWPFVKEGNDSYFGNATQKTGPYTTLPDDKVVSKFPIAMVTGMPVSLIVVVLSVIVVALLARRHVLRGKDSAQHPAMVLDSTQPNLYGDMGPGGQENCVYEEIAEYSDKNGGMIYYDISSTTVDYNIQPVEGIKDIQASEDVILHDLPLASFTSGNQESVYLPMLGRPIQEYEGPGIAKDLHNRNGGFTEGLRNQYANMGRAFLDALPADEISVPSSDIEKRHPELQQITSESGLSTIQGQYVLLQCTKPLRKPNTKEVALIRENISKNRDSTSVPSNIHRAHLTTLIDGRNDYINAVVVDGYHNRRAYIATQLPKPNTVIDFWRLVYDHKCSCIIALQQPDPEDESTPVYWPTTTKTPIDFGSLKATLVKEDNKDDGAISMKEFEITVSQKESHHVRLYQFLAWPADSKTSLPMEKMVMLLNNVQRYQLRSELGPLCFICKFGYERCGLMIAACYMLEKLNWDRKVDVYQAVKQVRIARPEFVTSLAQYEFLYELAIAYINYEDYTNCR